MRALLVATMIALPLAGCIGSFETVQELGWRPGFEYSYSVEVDGSVAVARYEDGEEVDTESEPIEQDISTFSYQVLSVDDESDGEAYAIIVTDLPRDFDLGDLTRSRSSSSLLAVRLQDMAFTSVQASTQGIVIQPPGPAADAPVRFPLTEDQSWERELAGSGITVLAEVEGAETIDGPNGRVEAIRVRHTIQFDEEEARREILEELEDEGATSPDVEFSIDAERVLWYAPSLHNIVRDEQAADFHVDIAFTTDDGVRRRQVVDSQATTTMLLTQATLSLGDDLDAAGILRAADIGAHPDVVAPDPGSGNTIKLTATGGAVGVSEGTTLALQVATNGLSSPLELTLTGPSKSQTTTVPATGGKAELTVEEPGLHEWVARSTGEDAPVSAKVTVAVALDDDVVATCPVVAVQSTCDPVAFDLPAGMDALVVMVTRSPFLIEPGVGTLRLAGPDGTESAELLGTRASIEVVGPAAGAYEATFETAGLADTVTFGILAKPKSPQVGTPATGLALLGWGGPGGPATPLTDVLDVSRAA